MKLKHLLVTLFSMTLVMHGKSLGAHHAISADFNLDEYITINVLVHRFRFINPHPYATATEIDAEEAKEWTLSLDDRWELVADGFSPSTLQPGDELIVIGMPSRREVDTLYVRRIERPSDGFVYVDNSFEFQGTPVP